MEQDNKQDINVKQTQVFGGTHEVSPEQFRQMLGENFKLERHTVPAAAEVGAASLTQDQNGNLIINPEGPDPLKLRGAVIDVPSQHAEHLTFGFGGQPVLSQGGSALPIVGISIPGGPSFNLFESLGYDMNQLQQGALVNLNPAEQAALADKLSAAIAQAQQSPYQHQPVSVRDMLQPEKRPSTREESTNSTQPPHPAQPPEMANPKQMANSTQSKLAAHSIIPKQLAHPTPPPQMANPTRSTHNINQDKTAAESTTFETGGDSARHAPSINRSLSAMRGGMAPLGTHNLPLRSGEATSRPVHPETATVPHNSTNLDYSHSHSVAHIRAVYVKSPLLHSTIPHPMVRDSVVPLHSRTPHVVPATTPPLPHTIAHSPASGALNLHHRNRPDKKNQKHRSHRHKAKLSKEYEYYDAPERGKKSSGKREANPAACGVDLFNYQSLATAALELTASWFSNGTKQATKSRERPRDEAYRRELAREGIEKAEKRRQRKERKKLEALAQGHRVPSVHAAGTQTSYALAMATSEHYPSLGPHAPARHTIVSPVARPTISAVHEVQATRHPLVPELNTLPSAMLSPPLSPTVRVSPQLAAASPAPPMSLSGRPLSPLNMTTPQEAQADNQLARDPQTEQQLTTSPSPEQPLPLSPALDQSAPVSFAEGDATAFGPHDISFGSEARMLLRRPVAAETASLPAIPTVVETATILHPQLRLNPQSGQLELDQTAVLGLAEQLQAVQQAEVPLEQQIQQKIQQHKEKHGEPVPTVSYSSTPYTQIKTGEKLETQIQNMAAEGTVPMAEQSDSSPVEEDSDDPAPSSPKQLASGPTGSKLFQLKSPQGIREVEMIELSAEPKIQMFRDFCNLDEIDNIRSIVASMDALPHVPNNLMVNDKVTAEDGKLVRRVVGRISALTGIDDESIVAVCPSVVSQTAADSTKEYDAIFRIYLDEQREGCESDFPFLGVSITPKQGCAVMWQCRNSRGIKLARSAHSERTKSGLSRTFLTAYIRSF
eukprot:Gregarina_sp_Poly_1__6046@NODE_318_length_9563_cov_157_467039_g272_i0_p1_GENE_NODE_318_length_9563_cov_157_467039_g272_i0NODE_318_length_9563_cov_157_467039_g272_i0_p1_ORF_typecomplete_len1003_score163_60_NODE_318_length_9563_cov_157_467039_g272_i033766384